MSRRRVRLLVAAPFVTVALVACGAGGLSADDVADGAEDALEAQVGARPDVSCPEELAAEVGAETRCTLTVGDDPAEYGVTVTVTSVEGDTARFDIQVDQEPAG